MEDIIMRTLVKKYNVFHTFSRATCNRNMPPSACEEEGINISTTVPCIGCVYRTLCDKLKCKTCQSSEEILLS